MTNNLRGIRKGLCAFAKKCKGFKYTDSALITFLITGAVSVSSNLFSAEKDGNIEKQKQIISTDIKDFNVLIKEARKENNKLLKNTNLELVKLMEQGDHVVKAPWSSWQFGANYFYDNWGSAYKGRGDKKEKYPFEGIYTRNSNLFTRNISPNSDLYKDYIKTIKDNAVNSALTSTLNTRRSTSYGLASTRDTQEPIVTVEINASIKPKSIQRNPITLSF